jgi:multisubunit Na+/H+ antiporter MnhB subunit
MKRKPAIPVTETARFGTGYETVNRFVGRRAVSPLALRINALMMPASVALTVLTILDVESDLRMWLALLVFCFGPGSALVQYFRLPDAAMQLGLIIAISTALSILLAQALLYFDRLDALIAVGVLTALTFLHPITRQNPRLKKEAEKQEAGA